MIRVLFPFPSKFINITTPFIERLPANLCTFRTGPSRAEKKKKNSFSSHHPCMSLEKIDHTRFWCRVGASCFWTMKHLPPSTAASLTSQHCHRHRPLNTDLFLPQPPLETGRYFRTVTSPNSYSLASSRRPNSLNWTPHKLIPLAGAGRCCSFPSSSPSLEFRFDFLAYVPFVITATHPLPGWTTTTTSHAYEHHQCVAERKRETKNRSQKKKTPGKVK